MLTLFLEQGYHGSYAFDGAVYATDGAAVAHLVLPDVGTHWELPRYNLRIGLGSMEDKKKPKEEDVTENW